MDSTIKLQQDNNIFLIQRYQEQIAQKHIHYDAAQVVVIEQLQALITTLLLRQTYETKSRTQKLFSAAPSPSQSLYIHGTVGGGKSMLMDLFYTACPEPKKRRVHFHAFMQETHARLHVLRQGNQTDLIKKLAEELAASVRVLCFDEFLVNDITDAMLLGRLFKHLFALGLVVVITSNYHPDNLYANGLQRDLFIPFIQLLKQTTIIIELNNTQDYRLQHLLTFRQRYYFPLNEYADYLIHQSYVKLTNDAPKRPGKIHLLGRTIKLTAVQGDIALSSFTELCGQALSAADYLQIACQFSTLILADIPRLTAVKRNEALRFSTLIDVLYDHNIKLICSADAPAEELYCADAGMFEFKRTASRLIEMQSEAYLQKSLLNA
ncbi:MAG: cell division protein ZapE [Methylococcaceae bacterium]|nr:cell division protein ZapE [Methylococcaceae bacterium]